MGIFMAILTPSDDRPDARLGTTGMREGLAGVAGPAVHVLQNRSAVDVIIGANYGEAAAMQSRPSSSYVCHTRSNRTRLGGKRHKRVMKESDDKGRLKENPALHQVLGAGRPASPDDIEVGTLCKLPH